MNKKKNRTLLTVLIAIALGVIIGSLTGTESSFMGVKYYDVFDTLGTIFINALSLVVVPLVTCSIITGIAKMGQDNSFGRLGLKTFAFYISTTFMAVIIGVVLFNLFSPGKELLNSVQAQPETLQKLSTYQSSAETISLNSLLLQIVPSNVGWSIVKGHMLSLIFFGIIFGYSLSKVNSPATAVLLNVCQGIFETMIKVTHLILKVLPLGVFCLVAKTFAATGIDSLGSLAEFFLTTLLGLAVFSMIILPLMLKMIGGINPVRHVKAMLPAIVTAFSTSSSSATLPVTMDCVEKKAGVSSKICSLVVPLGTSMNMSGSALYECIAAFFVAQAYGIKLSIFKQIFVGFMALLTSMGVAGIPAGSLVSVIVILQALGLPAEGIGLFLAVDRLLDMCRTTVNVFSDSCCAVLVAKSEGEKNILTK